MAKENIKKFENLMISDESLIARFNEASKSYVGDVNDERAFFDKVIAPIAEEAGVPFTFDELVKAKDNLGELDESELAAVSGGSGFCFLVGYSEGPEAQMNVYGECGEAVM